MYIIFIANLIGNHDCALLYLGASTKFKISETRHLKMTKLINQILYYKTEVNIIFVLLYQNQ